MSEEICRAFRNTGRCRYGEKCQYKHSEGEAIEPPPRGQCHNFEQTGACTYGDRCRFLHGDDADHDRFQPKPKMSSSAKRRAMRARSKAKKAAATEA